MSRFRAVVGFFLWLLLFLIEGRAYAQSDDVPPLTDPVMRTRACRLLRYQEAVDKSARDWWLSAGASPAMVGYKLWLDSALVVYFCHSEWPEGKPEAIKVAYLLRTVPRVDEILVNEIARAGKVSLRDETREQVTDSINEMTAYFMHLRMRGCGGLSPDAPENINAFLAGTNAHGIDVFGNELTSVSSGQVLPVVEEGSKFFDSRSVCSGSSGGGGGGHVPQAGSASGSLTCYMDTMQSQGHCQDGPAPALDIRTAFLAPGWLAMDGLVSEKPAAAEPETVTRSEWARDTIMIAAGAAYWIAQAGAVTGAGYTTLVSIGLAATPIGVAMGAIGLGVSTWAYYDKYYGEGRVKIGPRMCPMFSAPSGPFFMPSGIFAGSPFGGVDVFAGCAEIECVGALGLKTVCRESQFRQACQINPQAHDSEKCVSLMASDYRAEWDEASLTARFCSLATCADGSVSSYGAGGCACAESGRSSVGNPRLVYDPCWYSYCDASSRGLRWGDLRLDALRFLGSLKRLP